MKILNIFAHPDDEIIWGWPITQEHDSSVFITCDNKKGRSFKALEEVCDAENLRLESSPKLSPGFYRLNHRNEDFVLLDAVNQIKKSLLSLTKFDYYFTHNPHGEYGHGDHILLFRIVAELFGNKVIFGDARYMINHYVDDPFYINKTIFGLYEQDSGFVNRCIDVYKRHKAWTWKDDKIPKKLNLWRLT